MTRLFIGMPAYNEERFIGEAIDSLQAQDYTDWQLVISDNASMDRTRDICKEYIRKDNRIQYIRQDVNLYAGNFEFLLGCTRFCNDIDYFVLAGANDVWKPEFLSTCIGLLDEHPAIGMAFCNMQNIDSFGRTIRDYPKFTFAGPANTETVTKYLNTPEFMGKSNLVHSVFRVNVFREAWKAFPFTQWEWGYDYCFVLHALARNGACIDDRVLFRKRIVRDTDTPDTPELINVNDRRNYRWGYRNTLGYIKNNLRAVKGTPYYWVTMNTMLRRLV